MAMMVDGGVREPVPLTSLTPRPGAVPSAVKLVLLGPSTLSQLPCAEGAHSPDSPLRP